MSGEVTQLLRELKNGHPEAAERLIPLVYDELHRLAARYMAREAPDHTLQPTALINEAYLRLVDQTRVDWQGRAHFIGVAAQMMRRILINHARDRNAARRRCLHAEVTQHTLVQVLFDNHSRAVRRSEDVHWTHLDQLLRQLGVVRHLGRHLDANEHGHGYFPLAIRQ